ncbi:hypothetical protein lerEdw1_019469, partial [Lerista edwardsae]
SAVPSCLSLPTSDKPSEEPRLTQETSRTNGCVRLKNSQESTRQKSRSPSCDKDFTPPPARGKKKKKKSARKKRRRSPSCSPSPVKKKKKKKNSKKRKKNSSSSPKSKRKEGRKHKKRSRSQPRKSQRRHHRRCPSGSDSASSQSESCGSRPRARSQEEDHRARWRPSQHSSMGAPKPDGALAATDSPSLGPALQNHHGLSTTGIISKSGSSAGLIQKAEGQLSKLAKRNGEPREYDSGNDTSSPPSAQTTSSRSKGSREASGQVHNGLSCTFSSEKASSGSSSDSGNSFTSCVSQNKGAHFEGSTTSQLARAKDQRDRERDHKYNSSGKESHRHRDRRRRKQSYSPLRKRRRDSPSHLEARRITRKAVYESNAKINSTFLVSRSARKRPIPYYRPSPSTSSATSVSSYSSWYSSHSSSRSRSRSRSHGYSNNRTSCSRTSRSRSSESAGSYGSPRH